MKTIDMVTGFAKRFNGELNHHQVSSPLGMWLLLALAAERADDFSAELSQNLQECLGAPLSDAVAQMRKVFLMPPDSLHTAVGVWSDGVLSKDYENWTESIKDLTDVKYAIPSQEEVDKWAKDNTHGILEKFPDSITNETMLVIANALAAKVSWNQEFTVHRADSKMTGWGVDKVLLSAAEHPVFLAKVDGRLYGVHVAESDDAMRVYSVVAVEDDVPGSVVMAAAYEIARNRYEAVNHIEVAEQFADHPVVAVLDIHSSRPYSASLPAWDASSLLDLDKMEGIGADVLVAAFAERNVEGIPSIKQAVKASYHKDGFEAAAITSMMITRSAALPPRIQQLVVSFSRPFAVLSVANGHDDCIPAFNAWVTEAVEAE